ncbi:MAG: signal peptidase I [Bacteroidales bacterium]|nr:signal peptidase I [Bacteroidales bacterium]MCL2739196.1 signal peptidase I [Bacteroidales bacterium]
MNIRRIFSKTAYVLSIMVTAAGCLFALYFGLRIFVFDSYPVHTGSMIPAICPGDRIVVNKLIFGARLYRNLDFLDGGKLKTLRMKGYRGISYNDLVVFNHSHPMEFDIGTVYVKRCIGLPGDTIWIREGRYHNSSVSDGVVLKHFTQVSPHYFPDSLHICFPYNEELGWTILNFGPLYIPRKGDSINLYPVHAWMYKRIIMYEHGEDVAYREDGVYLNNLPIQTYIFKENYYFMAGDNFAHSSDSRYFGPVPETFIVGVAPLKINTGRRWERL